MLWPDPDQRPRMVEIRDNLTARIAEAEREGWHGEVEGLRVSLAGAEAKLAQVDRRPGHRGAVDLGLPTITQPVPELPAQVPAQRHDASRTDGPSRACAQAS